MEEPGGLQSTGHESWTRLSDSHTHTGGGIRPWASAPRMVDVSSSGIIALLLFSFSGWGCINQAEEAGAGAVTLSSVLICLLPSLAMKGHQWGVWESGSTFFSFSYIQVLPSLFGHEHTATMKNENSTMFPLNFCLLAAAARLALLLSFTTGPPACHLQRPRCGGSCSRAFQAGRKWLSQALPGAPPRGRGAGKQ